MARPHGKVLQGKEGGRDTQHWYNYIESKRAILRSKRWDGGGPACKSGTWWMIAKSLVVTEQPSCGDHDDERGSKRKESGPVPLSNCGSENSVR